MLLQGEADFISHFLSSGISLRAAGNNVINIGQMSQNSGLLFVAKKSSGIIHKTDLQGAKIGNWKAGFDEVPIAFLEKFNIEYIKVPIAYTVNLFLMDGIDVMTVMWYNEYNEIINSGFEEDELTKFFFKDYPDLNVPEDGIYCLEKTLNNDPEMCNNFIKASIEGWNYAFNNQEYTLNLVLRIMKENNVVANKSQQSWMLSTIDKLHNPRNKKFKKGKLLKKDFIITRNLLLNSKEITASPDYDNFYRGFVR